MEKKVVKEDELMEKLASLEKEVDNLGKNIYKLHSLVTSLANSNKKKNSDDFATFSDGYPYEQEIKFDSRGKII